MNNWCEGEIVAVFDMVAFWAGCKRARERRFSGGGVRGFLLFLSRLGVNE